MQETTAVRDFNLAYVRFGSEADITSSAMSALPAKADMRELPRNVCFVPIAS
jgi:hypothetical protein